MKKIQKIAHEETTKLIFKHRNPITREVIMPPISVWLAGYEYAKKQFKR